VEDQIKKQGDVSGSSVGRGRGFHPSTVLSDTNHLNKKRKRPFDNPMNGGDDGSDDDIEIPSSKMPYEPIPNSTQISSLSIEAFGPSPNWSYQRKQCC